MEAKTTTRLKMSLRRALSGRSGKIRRARPLIIGVSCFLLPCILLNAINTHLRPFSILTMNPSAHTSTHVQGIFRGVGRVPGGLTVHLQPADPLNQSPRLEAEVVYDYSVDANNNEVYDYSEEVDDDDNDDDDNHHEDDGDNDDYDCCMDDEER